VRFGGNAPNHVDRPILYWAAQSKFQYPNTCFFAFGGALLKTGLWVQCRFPVRALSQSGVFGFLFL